MATQVKVMKMDETIKINEIFYSIQGESSWSGFPTVFVRTSGCHLRCTYCDTKYAYFEGQEKTVDQILAEVESYGAAHVCVTGGEPLLQSAVHDLLKKLCDSGYKVSLETSGSLSCENVDSRVKKVIDVKTPSSGAADSYIHKNTALVSLNDEFKFVISAESDFEWAQNFCTQNNLFEKSNVFYSPSYNVIDYRWLADKIIEARSPARLQLQLHKIIWPEATRGV